MATQQGSKTRQQMASKNSKKYKDDNESQRKQKILKEPQEISKIEFKIKDWKNVNRRMQKELVELISKLDKQVERLQNGNGDRSMQKELVELFSEIYKQVERLQILEKMVNNLVGDEPITYFQQASGERLISDNFDSRGQTFDHDDKTSENNRNRWISDNFDSRGQTFDHDDKISENNTGILILPTLTACFGNRGYFNRETGMWCIPLDNHLTLMVFDPEQRNDSNQSLVNYKCDGKELFKYLDKVLYTDNNKYHKVRKRLRDGLFMVTPEDFDRAKRACMVFLVHHPMKSRLPEVIPVLGNSFLGRKEIQRMFDEYMNQQEQLASRINNL